MITADFSQLLIAGCLEDQLNFQKGGDTKQMEQIARHRTLTSILLYKKKYGQKFGNMVLACDGNDYWRTKYFPHYKGKRKVDKKESTVDWASIHSISNLLKSEIAETFPFKLILVPEAEADDVVPTLMEYLETQELQDDGLEERPQLVMNISADHDYRQLYAKYPNYSQFSPIQKIVVPHANKFFLLEKCLRGDAGDGIPSVRSADDHFMDPNSGRQKPVSAKMLEAFLANPDGSTLTEEEKKNLERNKTLIDFAYIPVDVKNKIIRAYRSAKPTGTQNDVFNYFIKHRCRALAGDIAGFF